ncbi:hypothetical protein [uncultured Jatrophihabitans sp.]|uniref:hypothetical protein n=1 Tax=uncultured Jatrophihabitans sp. TaxID=1610747 RepID=UPI0035C9DFFA
MVDVFGFTEETLVGEVVTRAAAVALSYTGGLFPRGAAGQVRYLHTVQALRSGFVHDGWTADDSDGVARTVHRGRGIAIVTAAGNELTGLPSHLFRKQPRTKWPRGEQTEAAVRTNVEQLSLFRVPGTAEVATPQVVTWILLQFAAETEVRSELSLPDHVDARGFVTHWSRRFILPPLSNEGGPDDDFGDEGGDIVIDVPEK